MQLWQRLYGTIWLCFFEFLLLRRWFGTSAMPVVHALLGLALVVLTQLNARDLAKRAVPARLKRISRATANLGIAQAILGVSMSVIQRAQLDVPPLVLLLIDGLHMVVALAMLAQSSSTATAYDMWEEKEFSPAPPPAGPAPAGAEKKDA